MDKRDLFLLLIGQKSYMLPINLVKYVSKENEFVLLYSTFRNNTLNIYDYENV